MSIGDAFMKKELIYVQCFILEVFKYNNLVPGGARMGLSRSEVTTVRFNRRLG